MQHNHLSTLVCSFKYSRSERKAQQIGRMSAAAVLFEDQLWQGQVPGSSIPSVKDVWTILYFRSLGSSMTSLALPRPVVQFCRLKLHPALHLLCLSLDVRDAGRALKFTLHC